MELIKGVCFCCDSDKVILKFESKKIHTIICSLFSNDINVEELDNVLSYMEICPFCYHKLLILESTSKNLKSNISSTENSKCLMCREGDVLFKINHWPHFKRISHDMEIKHNKLEICSDCLFYLDVRYTFKETFLNQYPELKLKPKLKLKIQKSTPSPSILKVENGKSTKKHQRLRFSDIDESIDSTRSTPVIDFSAIHALKPLKHIKSVKKSNLLNKDPKFIHQIPYVLLEVTNLKPSIGNLVIKKFIDNDMEEEVITTSLPTKGLKIKFKTKRKKVAKESSDKSVVVYPKSANPESVLQKYDFKKDLIINLPKFSEKNIFDTDDSVTTKYNPLNKSLDVTSKQQLISDRSIKNVLESSSEKKEIIDHTDTCQSNSEQLNLVQKHEQCSEKSLSKQKLITDDSMNQDHSDKSCEDLETFNSDGTTEITNTFDKEKTVNRSLETIQSANEIWDDNENVEEKNKRIQRKRSQSLYYDEVNEQKIEIEENKSEEIEISTEADVAMEDSAGHGVTGELGDEVEDSKSDSPAVNRLDINSEVVDNNDECADNENAQMEEIHEEKIVDTVDEKRVDFVDEQRVDIVDEKRIDTIHENSDNENTQQEEINNGNSSKKQGNTPSYIDEVNAVIKPVGKDNVNDFMSLIAEDIDKSSDVEEKDSHNGCADKDEASDILASKRKYNEDDDENDEINSSESSEKKKKKVTFSNDV